MALRLSSVSRLALLVGMALGAQQAQAQSLSDELTVLLADSPEINSLRNQALASGEGINEAYAGFLPTVDVSGDVGYEHTEEPTDNTGVGEDVNLVRRRVTATLRQRLFDGWGTQANYNSAELNNAVVAATLENTTQDLMFQGIRAYLEVLRADALIALADQNVEVIQTQLNLETERVERGSGITLDELQAKTRLQIAQERKVAFEGTLDQQLARYRRLFGHDAVMPAMSLPPIPESEIPASLAEAVAIAEVENPRGYGSDYNVQLAGEARTLANSGYYPTVDLVGRLNWEDDVNGTEGVRRDAAVLVEANWQIFSGFATDAGVARSAYQYVAAVNDRSAVSRVIVRDTELAWEQFMTSRERVELLENAVNIAIEVHAARVKLRDAGQETVLNVLDAQNDVFNAQINLVGAQYDMYLGVYRLLQAMGRLTADRVGATGPDVSALEGYSSEINIAASADEATVALASAPMPETTTAETVAVAEVVETVEVAESVEIVAASQPLSWPETEVENAVLENQMAAAETVTLVEPAPEPVQAMTVTYQNFDAAELEPGFVEQETQAALVGGSIVTDETVDDANLTRSWSFD